MPAKEPEPFVPRDRPIPIAEATPPPVVPAILNTLGELSVPVVHIAGSTPGLPKAAVIDFAALAPSALADRHAQPISPPVPDYPVRAETRGLEGDCDVRFDVTSRGQPYNVVATCTDAVFVSSAERAVGRVQFAPKIRNGQAVERSNVVYPLAYRLSK